MEIKQITGLRGVIAFLIAYVLHWALLFEEIPEFGNVILDSIFAYGCPIIFLSPNLFFLLSGYLIHQSYNSRISENKISFKDFMLPKVKKIYPMVIATAILVFVLQNIGNYILGEYVLHADGGDLRNSLPTLLLSFAGMQSGFFSDNDMLSVNGPAWFVSVLFLCYGIYYFITLLISKKWMRIAVYFIFILIGGWLIWDAPGLLFLYTVNGRGYLCFFLGVLINEVVLSIKESSRKNLLYIFSLLSCVCSFYICCINRTDIPHEDLILAVMFWPAFMYIVIHGFVLSKLLSMKVFLILGKWAMPIFLCNFPTDLMIRLCDKIFLLNIDYSNPWIWCLHVIVSLMIAYFFHVRFEKNLRI